MIRVTDLSKAYGSVQALLGVGFEITEGEIVEYCRGQIADYKVPRHVDVVEDFPRTTTNKIQRFILQKEIADRFSG